MGTRLKWDSVGERYYERGIDRGVLYVWDPVGQYMKGIAWSGLTGFDEERSSAVSDPLYNDGVKYLDALTLGEFAGTLSAITYPREFQPFDGVAEVGNGLLLDNQPIQTFSMSYRTKIGNDVKADLGYKLHFLYNLTAIPTNKSYATISDSAELTPFSWSLVGVPPAITGYRPTCHFTIDSRRIDPGNLAVLEQNIYGTDDVNQFPSVLPDPQSLINFFLLAG